MAFGKSYKNTIGRRMDKAKANRLHAEFRRKIGIINQEYANDSATRSTEAKRLRQEMIDKMCVYKDMSQVVLSRTLEREKYFSREIGRVRHRIL